MAMPMQASAQDLEFGIGRDGLRIERDCNPRYEDCYRDDRRRDYYDDRPRCSAGRALRKAEPTSAGAQSMCSGAIAMAIASTSPLAVSRVAPCSADENARRIPRRAFFLSRTAGQISAHERTHPLRRRHCAMR